MEDNISQTIRGINIAEYNYPLPSERIAWYPADKRDGSKLLISTSEAISQAHFSDIGNFLPESSLLVFNETRVVQARMVFHKSSGARIEIFCLEPLHPVTEVQTAFAQKSPVTWKCLVGNSRRWKSGSLETTIPVDGKEVTVTAIRTAQHDGHSEVEFHWNDEQIIFANVMEQLGATPLPPYIQREAEENDKDRYQTVYARNNGSVAAPTAGLHFTDEILNELKKKGIRQEKVTLHVGAGTFKPVSSETIGSHEMHTEQVMISRTTIEALKDASNRTIIPVGTTTARTLESVFWYGAKLHMGVTASQYLEVEQWDPYDEVYNRVTTEESLQAILKMMNERKMEYLKGETSLLIAPGYKWHFADALITNFHQPKSTLLLLVSSFIGERWKSAYDFALKNDFRFLSFGDSCLFFPK
jgi:S-adenosylmethionine:tRNA ribosyltransferase-isomerase